MIVVELRGGLGNQMFQYAFAKALSLKHNQPLLLDTSFLTQNQIITAEFTPRNYALDIFELKDDFASFDLVKSFQKKFPGKFRAIFKLPFKTIVSEEAIDTEALGKITFPVLVKGYWQSANYFSAFGKAIREVFNFREDVIEPVKHLSAEIENKNAVSVHIRRGDYLTNTIAKKVIGALPLSYYVDAIAEIHQKVNEPFFYIFCDDTEWAINNFPLFDNCRIIDTANKHTAANDLYLMTRCKHHIIANSSFSWWGAWLGQNPDKVIVAPKRWYASPELTSASQHLIPTNWISI